MSLIRDMLGTIHLRRHASSQACSHFHTRTEFEFNGKHIVPQPTCLNCGARLSQAGAITQPDAIDLPPEHAIAAYWSQEAIR